MANENFSGTYTVRYRIASQDGHVLTGDYKFYLDQPKAAVQQTPVAPIQNAAIDNSLSVIRQYATYIIGASVVAMLLFHRKKRSKG